MSRILFSSFDTASPPVTPGVPGVISTPSKDPRDLYKSVILMQSLPSSYRRDRESANAKRMACFGESDNQIGGLFGKANFYGETAIGGLNAGGAYPATAAALGQIAGAGLWSNGWLCEESSGNLIPVFGNVTLVASGVGNVIYGISGPIANDRAISVADNSSFSGQFTGGSAFDVTFANDLAVVSVINISSHGLVSGGSLGDGRGFGRICAKSTFGSGGGSYDLAFGNETGKNITFSVVSSSSSVVVTSGVVPINEWMIVMAVIERGTQTVRVGVRTLSGATMLSPSLTFIDDLSNVGSFQSFGTTINGAGLTCAAQYIAFGPAAAAGLTNGMEEALFGIAQTLFLSQDRSAISQARDTMFWDSANGKYLTNLGSNYGVPRPPQAPFDDELFRSIGQILSWLPKTPLLATHRLAEVIFGTQTSLQQANGRSWQIYEVNPNEIIFECPIELIAGTPANASYMHGFSGRTGVIVGLTNTITVAGTDARFCVSSGNLAGLSLYLFFAGIWNTYTISSSSFSAGINTFVVSASTVPTGNNYPMFVDVPGTSGFSGDFMLASASISGGGLNPPTDRLVYLYGQGRLDIMVYYINRFTRASGVILRTEVL